MWNKTSKVLVAAHRGNSIIYPENTMSAFKSALYLGVDMIETDLHMTKDREIIMMHDHTVDRTTDGSGAIRDKTLAEIKTLDAGSWKDPKFRGEKVPTFIEFLELVKDYKNMLFNIELKDYPAENDEEWAYSAADKILAMMDEYNISERSIINSWNARLLEYVYRKHGKKYKMHGYYPLFLMGDYEINPFEYLYCACLFNIYQDENKVRHKGEYPVCDREAFETVIKNNVQPWVYYKEDKEEYYRKSIEYGAKLFTSNDPKKAMQILKEMGLHS